MRPILFHLLGYPVSSHGVFYIIGFISTFLWGYYEARRVGVDPDKMMDVGFWLVIGIVTFSRLVFVAVEWRYYLDHPLQVFYLWRGGMVLYGGAIGVVVTTLLAAWLKKMPIGETSDVVAQAATLGLVFGRIGCLFAGCCYGRPTEAWLRVSYADPHSVAHSYVGNACVHPTQVYSMILLSCLFAFLVIMARRKSFSGQLAWLFFIVYPLGRFAIEIFRGDARGYVREPVLSRLFAPLLKNQTFAAENMGGFFHAPYLSTSQFLSVIALIAGVVGYIVSWRLNRRKILQSESNRDNNQ